MVTDSYREIANCFLSPELLAYVYKDQNNSLNTIFKGSLKAVKRFVAFDWFTYLAKKMTQI